MNSIQGSWIRWIYFENVCKLEALAVVDACANIGKSKGQEETWDECFEEMLLEVASDDVYEENDEPVSYIWRMLDGQADDDSQYKDGEYRDIILVIRIKTILFKGLTTRWSL